jgi:hypothetical protein
LLIDISEPLMWVESTLDVYSCAADLLAALESSDPVEDSSDSDS